MRESTLNNQDKSSGSFKRTLRRYIMGALCWLLACLMLLPFMPQIGYGAGAYAEPYFFYLTDTLGRVIYSSDPRVPVYYTADNPIDINDFEGYVFYQVLRCGWDENGYLDTTNYGNGNTRWSGECFVDDQRLGYSLLPTGTTYHGDTFLASDGYPPPPGANVDPELWFSDQITYYYYSAIWSPDSYALLSSAQQLDIVLTGYDPNSSGGFTPVDHIKVSFALTGGTAPENGENLA